MIYWGVAAVRLFVTEGSNHSAANTIFFEYAVMKVEISLVGKCDAKASSTQSEKTMKLFNIFEVYK